MAAAEKKKKAKASTLGAIVAHPLRSECLTLLSERTASPAEIAVELNENLGNVSYHVRKLWRSGSIEIVEEKPVRGAMEHFYRSVQRPFFSDKEIEEATPDQRTAFSRHIFSLVAANATTALATGTFVERPDYHISRVPMRVDEEGWAAMRDIQEETLERILQVQEECAKRLGKTDDTGFPVVAFNTSFEMPERPKKA